MAGWHDGEKVPNDMDRVLEGNRERAHSHIRLVTETGHKVANVAPTLPLDPTEVLLWGERFFIRTDVANVYREIRLTVVSEIA